MIRSPSGLIRSLYQVQGTHHLYLSTVPGVYLASGLLRDVQHVEILNLDPLLVRVRLTGTMWDVQVPRHPAAAIHWSGQVVEIIEGMPPDVNIVATLKSVGRDAFDAQALCEALAEEMIQN